MLIQLHILTERYEKQQGKLEAYKSDGWPLQWWVNLCV